MIDVEAKNNRYLALLLVAGCLCGAGYGFTFAPSCSDTAWSEMMASRWAFVGGCSGTLAALGLCVALRRLRFPLTDILIVVGVTAILWYLAVARQKRKSGFAPVIQWPARARLAMHCPCRLSRPPPGPDGR